MKRNQKLMAEWDEDKNGELTSLIKPFSHRKVWWLCDKRHSWEAAISGRSQGRGCPFCSGNKLVRERSLLCINDKLSAEWDFVKNKNTPSDVHANSSKKAWWVCSKEHSWEAVISSRNKGRGCPYCANKKVSDNNSLGKLRPDISKEWSSKNTSKTDSVSIGSETVVLWQCGRCSFEWEAPVYRRSQGRGCPACSGRVATTVDNLASNRPLLCKEWDYSSNNLLPSEVKEGSGKVVSWVCSEGHTWRTSIYHRARMGRGCPQCSGGSISKISQEWLDSLGVKDREVRLKIKTKAFTVDGFDPKTNTVYEFLGDFWHGNPEKFSPEDINPVSKKSFGELYDRTFRRFEKLEEAGYNVVFIWEKEYLTSLMENEHGRQRNRI